MTRAEREEFASDIETYEPLKTICSHPAVDNTTNKCVACGMGWTDIENKSDFNRSLDSRPSGGSSYYYELPKGATELRHLIRHKHMEHGIGEAFCSLYRLNDNGEKRRNLEKVIYYCQAELGYMDSEDVLDS